MIGGCAVSGHWKFFTEMYNKKSVLYTHKPIYIHSHIHIQTHMYMHETKTVTSPGSLIVSVLFCSAQSL